MINKVVPDAQAALAGIADGMTLMLGGFGLCGIPENAISELLRLGVWLRAYEAGGTRAGGARRIPFVLTHRRPDTDAASPAAMAQVVGAHFQRAGLPFVIGVNTFDGRLGHHLDEVRWALAVRDDVPVVPFDARFRGSVKDALLKVLDQALDKAVRMRQP